MAIGVVMRATRLMRMTLTYHVSSYATRTTVCRPDMPGVAGSRTLWAQAAQACILPEPSQDMISMLLGIHPSSASSTPTLSATSALL
jgi:hypothetical protein